ncbi:MAG: hypothetical protein RDV41_06335, partial [Planctomycetota bacterium]|nr:hypothetical protein [Planctomycetota bacterium]
MFTRSDFAALDGFRFERFELPNGLVLFVQRSARFKTLVVEAFIHSHLTERPTHTALVPHVLRRGCARYPNAPRMVQRLNFLYGAALSTDIAKIGERQILTFRLEFVSDRFLPRKGNLRNGIQFLADVMLRPLVVGNGFSPRYMETEKTNLRRFIESLIDDRATYAAERCVQEMCKDEPYGIYEHGRLEDIAAIDGRQLLSWHRALTRRNPIQVFVAGNVDPDEVRRVVESAFSFKRGKTVVPAPTRTDSRPAAGREVH